MFETGVVRANECYSKRQARWHNRDIYSIFFILKVCCVFSLESPHRGDSNEYIQYTIFNIKMKKENHTLNYPNSAATGFFLQGNQERVRNGRGKRAISIRAAEGLLYLHIYFFDRCVNCECQYASIPYFVILTAIYLVKVTLTAAAFHRRIKYKYYFNTIFTLPSGKSRKENPQKLTQLSSRSHPRHLVEKKDSTKRHHHRHHKRQPGEQQFPIQVVTG